MERSTLSILCWILSLCFLVSRNNASGSRRSRRISRVTGTCRARKAVHDRYFRRDLPHLFPSNCKNYLARGSFAQQIRFAVPECADLTLFVRNALNFEISLGIRSTTRSHQEPSRWERRSIATSLHNRIFFSSLFQPRPDRRICSWIGRFGSDVLSVGAQVWLGNLFPLSKPKMTKVERSVEVWACFFCIKQSSRGPYTWVLKSFSRFRITMNDFWTEF